MSSQRKISPIVAAAVVALVLIVLGISLRWWPWAIIVGELLCYAFGALGYLALNRVRPEAPQPGYLPPPTPAPEPPPVAQAVPVQGVELASAWPDYHFILDVTIYWRPVATSPGIEHFRPGARAVDAIIDRAATVAAAEEPNMAVRLQHRLNDILGVVKADPTGRVEAWADQVRTYLPEADAERLRKLADIQKDGRLWEHQRRFETDKRKYLTDDVLRSTGSALVWWLSRHEADVTQAADLIGTMARLSAAAQNEDIPTLFRHLLPPDLLPPEASRLGTVGSDGTAQPFDIGLVGGPQTPGDLVTELIGALRLDEEQHPLFAARVAANIEAAGNMTAAAEIRRRFDLLTDEPEPEAATNGASTWPDEDGNFRIDTPTTDTSGE